MKFENLVFGPEFYYSILSIGIKFAILSVLIYLFLVFFFPAIAKNIFPQIKLFMSIAKLLTCLLAVFCVFCCDYEAKRVVFFVSLNGMSFSTFLVGALALWELLAMFTDFLSTINDNLPD